MFMPVGCRAWLATVQPVHRSQLAQRHHALSSFDFLPAAAIALIRRNEVEALDDDWMPAQDLFKLRRRPIERKAIVNMPGEKIGRAQTSQQETVGLIEPFCLRHGLAREPALEVLGEKLHRDLGVLWFGADLLDKQIHVDSAAIVRKFSQAIL